MDKKWVRDQLVRKGDQAALAKYLNVSESLMSKMLSDNYKRELREREASKIRQFLRAEERIGVSRVDRSSYAQLHSNFPTMQESLT